MAVDWLVVGIGCLVLFHLIANGQRKDGLEHNAKTEWNTNSVPEIILCYITTTQEIIHLLLDSLLNTNRPYTSKKNSVKPVLYIRYVYPDDFHALIGW